jgi:hypothetical protein
VDGLVLVSEKGTGDDFGIGNDVAHSVMEVAGMFGGEIVTLPERKGNRQSSGVDTAKTCALGWSAKRSLADDITAFLGSTRRGEHRAPRILVYSTTFAPDAGPAEKALEMLITQMPSVHFDIITTKYRKGVPATEEWAKNATLHRVGSGRPTDKFLLPILGYAAGKRLAKTYDHLFAWSLMASYGAFAAIFLKRSRKMPLLITLADQHFGNVFSLMKPVFRLVFRKADQVHASSVDQEKDMRPLMTRMTHAESLGSGDAFANQIRFSFSTILRGIIDKN